MQTLPLLKQHDPPNQWTVPTGHPFRAATDHRWKGAQVDIANTDRLVPRAPPLAGPGQNHGLTSFPDSPGPETDMRSSPPVHPRSVSPEPIQAGTNPIGLH